MNKVYSLFLVGLVLTACTSKQIQIGRSYEFKKVRIPAAIHDISIRDNRENVTVRGLKIPVMSFPWNHDEVSPLLTASQKSMIRDEVKKYFVNGKDKYSIKIEIYEGKKIFDAKLFTEEESVKFSTKIVLTDIANSSREISGSGEVWMKVGSLDASRTFMNEFYLRAIKASINKCFKEIALIVNR